MYAASNRRYTAPRARNPAVLMAALRQKPLLIDRMAVEALPPVIPRPTRAVLMMLPTTPTACTSSGNTIPL